MQYLYPLSPAENKIICDAELGKISDFGTFPENTDFVGERLLRAEVIMGIFQTANTSKNTKGVRIKGAKIIGTIDFEGIGLNMPLSLVDCLIADEIILTDAQTQTLKFSGSKIVGISAERLNAKGTLYVDNGFVCEGAINLRDAVIAKSFTAQDSIFSNPNKEAFYAPRLIVGGELNLQRLKAFGRIVLVDAQVGGSVIFTNSILENTAGNTLEASRISVKGSMFFHKTESSGQINLALAVVGGEINFDGAKFKNALDTALRAPSIQVKDGLYFRQGFNVIGKININFANIGNLVLFEDVQLTNQGKIVLLANELTTGGSFRFDGMTNCNGKIEIIGANIGGTLYFGEGKYFCPDGGSMALSGTSIKRNLVFGKKMSSSGGIETIAVIIGGDMIFDTVSLYSEKHFALIGDRMLINGDLKFFPEFESKGMVQFTGAKIGGQLLAKRARFQNREGVAFGGKFLKTGGNIDFGESVAQGEIQLSFADIGQNLILKDAVLKGGKNKIAFTAIDLTVKGAIVMNFCDIEGKVVLNNSRIGGDMICEGVCFHEYNIEQFSDISTIVNSDIAFTISLTEIKGSLTWSGVEIFAEGEVDFSGAKVRKFIDNKESWANGNNIYISDFTYETFNDPGRDISTRLAWIRQQKSFNLQPYEQLVKVFKLLGHESNAKEIARAKRNDIRNLNNTSFPDKAWNWFLNFTMGHGYQVWRIPLIACVIIAIGTVVFGFARYYGIIVEIKDKTLKCPPFNPIIYSIDVFLPIVDLKQENYYLPLGRNSFTSYVMIYLWIQILLGWIMTTLGIAGLTGVVKKD